MPDIYYTPAATSVWNLLAGASIAPTVSIRIRTSTKNPQSKVAYKFNSAASVIVSSSTGFENRYFVPSSVLVSGNNVLATTYYPLVSGSAGWPVTFNTNFTRT